MFFSNKDKKPTSSRMLTEAEIKKKLYGDYDTASGAVHSSSHEIKMTGSAFSTAVASDSNVPNKSNIRTQAPAANAGFNDIPPRKLTPAVQPTSEWKKIALQVGRTALGILTAVLWKLSSYFIRGLDFVLRLLDPRKPQARKLLYSITACILVIALFWGVFRLNNQRKKAMLGELSTTPVITESVSAPAATEESAVASSSEASGVESSSNVESHEAILNTLGETPVSLSSTEVAPPPASAGRYVIQVATYASIEDANRVIQGITQAGFSAFYKKQIRNSTGHAFYPIYLGRFESNSVAQQTLSKFRKAGIARPFQDAFIRTLE